MVQACFGTRCSQLCLPEGFPSQSAGQFGNFTVESAHAVVHLPDSVRCTDNGFNLTFNDPPIIQTNDD